MCDFRNILVIYLFISSWNSHKWMPQDLIDDKSTLVEVIGN